MADRQPLLTSGTVSSLCVALYWMSFFNYSGLYRPVYIWITPIHISDRYRYPPPQYILGTTAINTPGSRHFGGKPYVPEDTHPSAIRATHSEQPLREWKAHFTSSTSPTGPVGWSLGYLVFWCRRLPVFRYQPFFVRVMHSSCPVPQRPAPHSHPRATGRLGLSPPCRPAASPQPPPCERSRDASQQARAALIRLR